MARTSHALEVDGRVWLFDVVDWPELDDAGPRARRAGRRRPAARPAQPRLRRRRAAARRPAPRRPPRSSPGRRSSSARSSGSAGGARWRSGGRSGGSLLVADALGTIPFFRAGDEPAGVHPVLRLRPPRSLRGLEPDHLLVGHGEGIHPRSARGPRSRWRRARVARTGADARAIAARCAPTVWVGTIARRTRGRRELVPIAQRARASRPGPDEARRRLQAGVPHRRVERLGERRGARTTRARRSAGASP